MRLKRKTGEDEILPGDGLEGIGMAHLYEPCSPSMISDAWKPHTMSEVRLEQDFLAEYIEQLTASRGLLCGEGPGGEPIGTPCYDPGKWSFTTVDWEYATRVDEDPGGPGPPRKGELRHNIAIMGKYGPRLIIPWVRLAENSAEESADLNCYEFYAVAAGGGLIRIYVPGQVGYHAWHQGLGDAGYECALPQHQELLRKRSPEQERRLGGYRRFPSLAEWGCLSASVDERELGPTSRNLLRSVFRQHPELRELDRASLLRELLQSSYPKPWVASRLFAEWASYDAREAMRAQKARVWRSVYRQDPVQVNVEWIAQSPKGEDAIIRVSFDEKSGQIVNWMVVDDVPTSFFYRNWKRLSDRPDILGRELTPRELNKFSGWRFTDLDRGGIIDSALMGNQRGTVDGRQVSA